MNVIDNGQFGKLCTQPRHQIVTVVRVAKKQHIDFTRLDEVADKLWEVLRLEETRQIENIRRIILKTLTPALLTGNRRQDTDFKTLFVNFPTDIQIKQISAAHFHPREQHHDMDLVMALKYLAVPIGAFRCCIFARLTSIWVFFRLNIIFNCVSSFLYLLCRGLF